MLTSAIFLIVAVHLATAIFVDIRVRFTYEDNPIQNISGICTNRNNVVCASTDIRKFAFIITDGRLSLNDPDFTILKTGEFITENNTIIENIPITAFACDQEACMYRHAALAQENIWQPISKHEQFMITHINVQTIQIPVFAQAIALYYGSSALQCLRIQSDYNFTILSINGQAIVGNVQHNESVPIVDENAMYNYYYPYEDFLIQPNSDSSVLTLVVHNPKNNIAPMRVWAQVTSAQNECYLLTTITTTPTSTITTTMTSTITTTATTTIAPLCGFSTGIALNPYDPFVLSNGENVCGGESYTEKAALPIDFTTPASTWGYSVESLNSVNLRNSWIQPNQHFFGPITFSCPSSTSCQVADTIVHQNIIQANYANSLCVGLANLTFNGPPINYNYDSTEMGCDYEYATNEGSLCFCQSVHFNAQFEQSLVCGVINENVTLYTFRCLPV